MALEPAGSGEAGEQLTGIWRNGTHACLCVLPSEGGQGGTLSLRATAMLACANILRAPRTFLPLSFFDPNPI